MKFSLPEFLNQAAEAVSRDFQTYDHARYGMLRTEWRVLFHLRCYGDMTGKRIFSDLNKDAKITKQNSALCEDEITQSRLSLMKLTRHKF